MQVGRPAMLEFSGDSESARDSCGIHFEYHVFLAGAAVRCLYGIINRSEVVWRWSDWGTRPISSLLGSARECLCNNAQL